MRDRELTFLLLRRKNGAPLILGGFRREKLTPKDLDEGFWRGIYGAEPRIEAAQFVRQYLYDLAEKVLVTGDRERRFIPRFLASFGIFMVLYFVFTVVIRTPLPFPYKALLSLGASVGAFFALRHYGEKTSQVAEKRIIYREAVDQCRLEPDPRAQAWQMVLSQLEDLPPAALWSAIRSSQGELAPRTDDFDPFLAFWGPHRSDLKDLLHRHRRADLAQLGPRLAVFFKNRRLDPLVAALSLDCLPLQASPRG